MHAVALVGDIFGGIAVFVGLYLSPWLLFLGVLTILGSQGAMELERLSRTLHSLTVKDALVKDILVLSPTTLLEDAARIALREDQREILVGTSGALRGVISFDRLLHELRQRGSLASLKDLELDKTPWIQDDKLPLTDAYDILESFQLSLVPLVGVHKEIVGCVTVRSIQNCLLLAEAQREGETF